MGDVEFEGVGGGELGRVSLTGFMELGEAMDRVGVVCRIEVLEPKVFPEDRGFRSSERFRGEANDRMGRIDRPGVETWGEGNWNVRGCEKPKNRAEAGTVGKKGWGMGKEPPCRRKLTQRSESFCRWVAE